MTHDILSPSSNWLLIENRTEEENIEACARFHINQERIATVDIFAYSNEKGDKIANELRCYLLCKIESILLSLSIESIVFEVLQYHTDLQDWIAECGYSNESGSLVSQTEIDRLKIVKPTLLLKFQVCETFFSKLEHANF